LRNRNTIRRLGLALSILFVVAIAGGIISWAVETPAKQREGELQQKPQNLNDKIQTPPTPSYQVANETDSSVYSCDLEDELNYAESYCPTVFTEKAGAMKLASITEDLYASDTVLRVEFYSRFEDPSSFFATSYCFESKNVADHALGSSLDDAEFVGKLVGKTTVQDCYLAIYDAGFEPELKPASSSTQPQLVLPSHGGGR